MIKINNIPFGESLFPNGEAVFNIIESDFPLFEILLQFESNKDIGDLMFAVEYIRGNFNPVRIELILPFVPYGRMDRQIDEQMFSLQYFANIINKMEFHKVYCYDPHSGVTKDLIHNLVDGYTDRIRPLVIQTMMDCGASFIHFPDDGAQTKYKELLGGLRASYTVGSKKRDTKDKGKLLGMELDLMGSGRAIKGQTVLIVDDICVRGGTFIMAAEKLLEAGAAKVCLFVTHCENAIFEGDIFKNDIISKVYTTDTIRRNRKGRKNRMVEYTVWKGNH